MSRVGKRDDGERGLFPAERSMNNRENRASCDASLSANGDVADDSFDSDSDLLSFASKEDSGDSTLESSEFWGDSDLLSFDSGEDSDDSPLASADNSRSVPDARDDDSGSAGRFASRVVDVRPVVKNGLARALRRTLAFFKGCAFGGTLVAFLVLSLAALNAKYGVERVGEVDETSDFLKFYANQFLRLSPDVWREILCALIAVLLIKVVFRLLLKRRENRRAEISRPVETTRRTDPAFQGLGELSPPRKPLDRSGSDGSRRRGDARKGAPRSLWNKLERPLGKLGSLLNRTLESPLGKTKLFLYGGAFGAAIVCPLFVVWSNVAKPRDYALDAGGKTFLKYGGTAEAFVVPKGVEEIAFNAFADCSSLKSVVFPQGIKKIGDKSFSNCSSLTSVVIPDGVAEIADAAFEGCSSLKSVEMPESVESVGIGAFRNCSSLTSVDLPDGIETIREETFLNCRSLSSATLPPRLKGVKRMAFANCESLRSLVIPETTTSVSDSAFSGCRFLSLRVFRESYAERFAERNDIQYEIVGGGGPSARQVEPIDVPKDYRLGDDGTTLERYTGTARSFTAPEGVKTIGSDAFRACSTLTIVRLPDSAETIQEGAFADCDSLREIDLPPRTTQIEANLFSGCVSLIQVSLPSGVVAIKTRAFAGCESLRTLAIPANVERIESRAFVGCKSLQTVEIPNPTTFVESNAFDDCERLTIRAPKGSFAEQYAAENDVKFEPL